MDIFGYGVKFADNQNFPVRGVLPEGGSSSELMTVTTKPFKAIREEGIPRALSLAKEPYVGPELLGTEQEDPPPVADSFSMKDRLKRGVACNGDHLRVR